MPIAIYKAATHQMNRFNSHILLALRHFGNLLSFRGRIRLPQKLLWFFLRDIDITIKISDFDGNLDVKLCLSEHMQRRIYWLGYYNLQIVPYLKHTLLPGMTFIDIGANIGEISMVAAKCVGNTGRVIAFEPIDVIADELQSNITQNQLSQVSIIRMGLSDSPSSNVPIYVSCGQGRPGDENKGLGSIYEGKAGGIPLQRIEITSLDAWLEQHPLERVDMIKIDIEGAELPCLIGAEQTLRKFKPILIVEMQDTTANIAGYRTTDISDYLTGLGYILYKFNRHGETSVLDARNRQANHNVLCIASA